MDTNAHPRPFPEWPTRRDWYVALFTVIAAIAGLFGLMGIVSLVAGLITPTWFDAPEPLPWSFFAFGFTVSGGALALSFIAARLAWRRAGRAG
jgi:hypothetical protein